MPVNDDNMSVRRGKFSGPGAENCALCTIAGIAGNGTTVRGVEETILSRSGISEPLKIKFRQEYENDPAGFSLNIVNDSKIFRMGTRDARAEMKLIGGTSRTDQMNAAAALVIAWYFQDSHDIYYLGSLQENGKKNVNELIELMNQQRSKVKFAIYAAYGHWEVAENVPIEGPIPFFRHSINKKTLTFTDYQTDNTTYRMEKRNEGAFPRTGHEILSPLEDDVVDEVLRTMASAMAIALFPRDLKDRGHTANLRRSLSV